jgi:ubiquinone/menaquinone biosynthesis C-methylase UbiE
MLAMRGYDVVGIEVEDVISYAKAKAIERNVKVNLVVGNVLEMDRLFKEGEFGIVIDCGLFHTFHTTEIENRLVFARQVCRVLKTGGKYLMLGISYKELIVVIP